MTLNLKVEGSSPSTPIPFNLYRSRVSSSLDYQKFWFPLMPRSVLLFQVAEYVQNGFHVCQVSPRLFAPRFQLVEQVVRKREILRLPEQHYRLSHTVLWLMILRSNWQINRKFRSLSDLGIHLNCAVMFGNYLMGNSQPQSSTFADRLCCEKWVKYV